MSTKLTLHPQSHGLSESLLNLMTSGDTGAAGKGRIYCDPGSRSASLCFGMQGFSLVEARQAAELVWIRRDHNPEELEILQNLAPNQLFNHFPHERAMINKGCLTETLRNYEATRPESEAAEDDVSFHEFYQETYCLYDPADRTRFFDQLPPQDSPENLWILKPGALSSGRGVRVMWRMDALREEYAAHGSDYITELNEQAIIQRYIKNPLLLDKRKSEIRIYWLIASIDPLLVLLYDEGTVRLTELPFQLDDFDNPRIHLANIDQQKSHPDHDPKAVLKWSYAEFDRDLADDVGLTGPDFTQTVLYPKLKKYLSHVVRATHESLAQDYPTRGDCFGVYGADVLLDDELNPSILEIQVSPGLSFSDPVKQTVIPAMLGEAARIVLEIRERRRCGQSLVDLQSVEHYQWVINSSRPHAWP